MDESVQKQIEAALPKLERAEHWVWKYPAGFGFFSDSRGYCNRCLLTKAQTRAACMDGHGWGRSEGAAVLYPEI